MPAYGSDTLRLFVAAYPPPEVVDAWRRTLRGLDLPPHRETPPEQVHLTLHFMGDTDRRQLDNVVESVRRSASGLSAFTLNVDRLISLPDHGPARLIAAAAKPHPTAAELHERLARRLARPGKGRGEFLPHMTLCRFSAQTRARTDLAIEPTDVPVGSVWLMRSVLGVSGAAHAQIAEVRLEPPAPKPAVPPVPGISPDLH